MEYKDNEGNSIEVLTLLKVEDEKIMVHAGTPLNTITDIDIQFLKDNSDKDLQFELATHLAKYKDR